MAVENPSQILYEEALNSVLEALEKHGIHATSADLIVKSGEKHGDVSVLLFKLLKSRKTSLPELSEALRGLRGGGLFRDVIVTGAYVNFDVNVKKYGEIVLRSIAERKERYGWLQAPESKSIIVEHTSANPIHPLHVGHLRNSILGDSLARLFAARGHRVKRHFYIDDVGLQVAYAAYGYRLTRDLATGKPDHFVGDVYTMINLLLELEKLKKKVAEGREVAEANARISAIAAKLKEYMEKRPEVFERLVREVKGRADEVEEDIRRLNRAYEHREKWAVDIIREMVEKSLSGFRETFGPLEIEFDSWDWESEITVWSGATERILRQLVDTGFVEREDGALVFRADKVAEDPEARAAAGIPESFQVTPMTLVRSDGTTLYTTRDIAYSIWKLSRAEIVVNVIAIQQTLAQAQLRLALYLLGYRDIGRRLIHYSYELVKLPGRKMSGRRGEYVAADDIIGEAIKRARVEIERRGIGRPEDAVKIGIGALKYFFLNVSPQKPITFRWDRVLDFEQNSGPFVQYAYVRARGILRKALEVGAEPAILAEHLGDEEKKLILLLGEFPSRVALAADQMRPDIITAFLNSLAMEFNRYYDRYPVIKAPSEEKRRVRLALVDAVATTLKNGLLLLGIEPPERM